MSNSNSAPAVVNGSGNGNNNNKDDSSEIQHISERLHEEAQSVLQNEPELCYLLYRTVLADGVESFEDAVTMTVCSKLLMNQNNCTANNGTTSNGNSNGKMMMPTTTTNGNSKHRRNSTTSDDHPTVFCPQTLRKVFRDCFDNSDILEMNKTMKDAVRQDALAYVERDPATTTILEVVLFHKGFASLVCHRAAFRLSAMKRKFTALLLQSMASSYFGVDIHPMSQIGSAVMLDHGTGIVVGETAKIGHGCTILHGVTLGGTGKQVGDRHPKVGNNVLIGANSSLLGNIQIGNDCKIGAGSVVLRPLPNGATAVGAPAKIVGRVMPGEHPGSEMDELLQNVKYLHKSSNSTATLASTMASTTTDDGFLSSSDLDNSGHKRGSGSSDDDDSGQSGEQENGDSICPFREYALLGKSAPPGSVTLCKLYQLLKPYGATTNQVGNCMFAMDARSVGHVSLRSFRAQYMDVLVENTPLDASQIEEAVSPLLLGAV